MALHLNKLKSTPPMNVLCKVSLKLAQWFWKRRFFKFCQCNSISLLSPLGKRHGPSFEQTWFLVIKEFFLPSLFEIAPVVLEKKIKTWRIYNDIDHDDNDDMQHTNFDQTSSLEPIAKRTKKSLQMPKQRRCISRPTRGLWATSPKWENPDLLFWE